MDSKVKVNYIKAQIYWLQETKSTGWKKDRAVRFKYGLQQTVGSNRAAYYLQVFIHLLSYNIYCENLLYVKFELLVLVSDLYE